MVTRILMFQIIYIDEMMKSWSAVIHTLSDDKFLVKRVNLNLKRNSFEAKLNDSDSIFSFTFNNIKKIMMSRI